MAMAPTINNAIAPLATRAKAPQINATEPKNSVKMTKSARGVGIPDVEKALNEPEKP
jgi:hypothetical protein